MYKFSFQALNASMKNTYLVPTSEAHNLVGKTDLRQKENEFL